MKTIYIPTHKSMWKRCGEKSWKKYTEKKFRASFGSAGLKRRAAMRQVLENLKVGELFVVQGKFKLWRSVIGACDAKEVGSLYAGSSLFVWKREKHPESLGKTEEYGV